MFNSQVQDHLSQAPNHYQLAVAAMIRARQLNSREARPLVESESKSVTNIALEEIAAGKLRIVTEQEDQDESEEKTD